MVISSQNKVLYAIIRATSSLKIEPLSQSLKELHIQAELLGTLP
jgi:hypothetical protein